MDDIRVGRLIRALRRRRGWRQADLGELAGVSQQEISVLERGQLGAVPLRLLRRVLQVLEASADLDVRWRGGAIDRLLDDAHAPLVAGASGRLVRLGWESLTEVTYSIYGERGSIDVLGLRRDRAAAVVTEVKSDLMSVEQTQRKHDEKVRLVGRICAERVGWTPQVVGRLLVLPESATARRRVARAAELLRGTYPLRGREVDAWLREPRAAAGGILFLPDTTGRSAGGRLAGPSSDGSARRPPRGHSRTIPDGE